MPTHSQLAAQLLRDAAAFFQTIGEQNEPLKVQMMENAAVFSEVAMLVENDPLGDIQDSSAAGAHNHAHGDGCCGGGHHHHDHDDDDHGHKHDNKGGCCN